MLKALLCAAVLALCVLAAYLMTRRYRLRKDFYYNFDLFNQRFANEVSYTRTPLPAFVGKYAFGGDFAKMLEEKKRSGFGQGEYAFDYLTQDERKFLADYFLMIGRSDAASQRTYLAAVRGEIGEKKRAAEEAYRKYFSLYLKLGVLAGLVLVILIV